MKFFLYLVAFVFHATLFAQQKGYVDTTTYPQHYFRNPLEIPILLAGNFGECRPGHFHSGMDIKTLGEENQKVHAAADGYISRIKMEKGGFGHGIYITHPNGYTTLYAHLNDFMPALQAYVKKEQYARRRWDVDLSFTPAQFPVKQGDLIAWSGNTGASTAPHLHFEVRDSKTEHPLNPQLFGFQLVDTKPPVPVEVVLYRGNVYEDRFLTVALEKKGEQHKPAKTDDNTYAVKHDTVQVPAALTGIGINVDDYMDGSENTISFYTAKLYMDDSLQSQVTLDDIGYEETRYINSYVDFKTKELKRKWIQLLFKLPGNGLNKLFSHLNSNSGRLDLNDKKVHKVSILLTDDKGNISTIFFYVSPQPVFDMAQPQRDCVKFSANKTNVCTDTGISFTLDNHQLYDDICFRLKATHYSEIYSGSYQVHYPYVPLHHYFDMELKADKPIPADKKNKVVMMYSDGKDQDGRVATPKDNGWYKAKVRNFGTYWLDIDDTPPVIRSMQKEGANMAKAKQILFEIKDAMTSVRSFSGYLDGQWICFEQHGSSFFYKFDEHCPRGKHKLVFKAEDENGNTNTFQLNFTR